MGSRVSAHQELSLNKRFFNVINHIWKHININKNNGFKFCFSICHLNTFLPTLHHKYASFLTRLQA